MVFLNYGHDISIELRALDPSAGEQLRYQNRVTRLGFTSLPSSPRPLVPARVEQQNESWKGKEEGGGFSMLSSTFHGKGGRKETGLQPYL